MVAPRLKVPLTALLWITQARRSLVENQVIESRLELHLSWDSETVSIDGEKVPLENEPKAAMALTFSDVPEMELERFRISGPALRRHEGQSATRLHHAVQAGAHPGGATRMETFLRLFRASSAPLVLQHDVVHPFASPDLAR